jgi:serine/threonine protein kinase
MKVAIKSISKHDALKARRLRISGRTYVEEWEILKQLSENQHVVSLLDIFETSEEIQLVLEYCPGGELFDAIQRKQSTTLAKHQYTEEDASVITQQLLHALQDIHQRGIAHKDIKPENILLFSTEESRSIHVKLCDFGMARVICQGGDDNLSCDGDASPATPSRTQSFQLFASDYYTAPELQLGCGLYDTAVDMFSLGVTVYILLCGFPPVFEGDDSDCVAFPSLYWKNISEEAKDFVRSLLVFEPAFRISAERAMKHPWIRNGDRCSGVLAKKDLTTDGMRMALLKRRLYQCFKHPKLDLSSFGRSRDKDKYRQHRKRPRRATVIQISLADLCATGVTASPSVGTTTSSSFVK